MYHRPQQSVRTSSNRSFAESRTSIPRISSSPRLPPLLPPTSMPYSSKHALPVSATPQDLVSPRICGMPLKYVSLVTLAVQNAALSIVMHYSRVSTPPSLAYSPASAVLLNELLKGSISFVIALSRTREMADISWRRMSLWEIMRSLPYPGSTPFWTLCGEIFSPDWSAHDSAPLHIHVMSPLKGFGAVTAACFTSGLAGVYFEMVLKNSKADLWVRNVQLSLFSLIPALLPILYSSTPPSVGFFEGLFRNFGIWAWATVAIQVFGGLVTAIVIKYSDNILKGFATSLSIVLSFLASVMLFDFRITPSFVIGASTVLCATWMYNQPPGKDPLVSIALTGQSENKMPFTPVDAKEPIIGEFPRKKSSTFGSPRGIATALGLSAPENREPSNMLDTQRYNHAPYGSPFPSRPPSRAPSRTPTPQPPPASS
ncbi:hypothetical protein HHX47_DHR3001089 [Lentinula edodes]|nr:hypothetical protein HHX47_DHR3001089 [Lentinula edodes]